MRTSTHFPLCLIRSQMVCSSILITGLVLFAMMSSAWADPPSEVQPTSAQGLKPQINHVMAQLQATFKAQSQTPGQLFTVAVMPLKALDAGAKEANVVAALTELCATRLSEMPGVIQVERGRIDSVINELKRSQSGQLSPKYAAQAGKLIGASHVLLGTVSTVGANLQISVRLVTAETGVVLKGASALVPRQDLVAFSKDVVLVKSRGGALFRSLLIPGWGQIYNGDSTKGWLFLSASAILVGSAGTYALLGRQAETEYQDNTQQTVPRRRVANQHYGKVNTLLLTAGALWITAALDAVLSWRDTRQINLKGWVGQGTGGLSMTGSF